MVGQEGQRHGVPLTKKPSGLLRHLHLGHQIINHGDIGLKLNRYSPHIILLIDELALIENVLQL